MCRVRGWVVVLNVSLRTGLLKEKLRKKSVDEMVHFVTEYDRKVL